MYCNKLHTGGLHNVYSMPWIVNTVEACTGKPVAVQIGLQKWKWTKCTLRNNSFAIQKQALGTPKDDVEQKLKENTREGI